MQSAEQYGISKNIPPYEKKNYETVQLNCDPKLEEVKAMILGTGVNSTTPREERKVKPKSMISKATSEGAIDSKFIDPQVKRQQERLLNAAKQGKDLNDSYFEEEEQSETPIHFDKYSRQGYESSSTVQGEVVYGA